MEEQQSRTNQDLQQRVRELEAQQEINLSLLVALVSTREDREAVSAAFQQASEQLITHWLAHYAPTDFVRTGMAYRESLYDKLSESMRPSK